MTVNRDAFWSLLEGEHVKAEAFCRRLAGSREEGDDLYQEAILRSFLRCESLRDPKAFRPWLYRIIVNLYKNRRRGPWWRRLVPASAELEESAPGTDPTGVLDARRWLERAFSAITLEERTLVSLFELEGWTIAELSQLYRKPEGTIKARLSRARVRMRKELMKYLRANKQRSSVNRRFAEAQICVATKSEPE